LNPSELEIRIRSRLLSELSWLSRLNYMGLKRISYTLVFLMIAFFPSYSQNKPEYLLPNEELIFSFDTQTGKKMFLAKDTINKYIVYRFGSKVKIELEFPDRSKESWKEFTYDYYMRGGGVENAGYFEGDDLTECGIKIEDKVSGKVVDIKGNTTTIKGTLIDFRINNLIEREISE
jgi:hypothetical protein